MTIQTTHLHWFRKDLRVSDNPGLQAAQESEKIIFIYIWDKEIKCSPGAASRWWLHHSLNALNDRLDNKLNFYSGKPIEIIKTLIKQHNITTVTWNRCYTPEEIERDTLIKDALIQQGTHCESFNASLLWEPFNTTKKDGSPYKVFTPFYKNCNLNAPPPRAPLSTPSKNKPGNTIKLDNITKLDSSIKLSALNLLPRINWDAEFYNHWKPGEDAAQEKCQSFIEETLDDYKQGRDIPAQQSTSRLSPHLHFGEISPHQIWQNISTCNDDHNGEHFKRELAWREFCYSLLYFFPEFPHKNFAKKFDKFPWQTSSPSFEKWKRGETGYPIVDAGMRELWQTGFMHNRVRMITSSFLVKNLLLDWRLGERWFRDCLVDADLANNSAGWQWCAGCGADAAPYFRIFNPVTQGEKFDPDGHYTCRYIPALKNLPRKYLHKPWEAPENILSDSGLTLDKDYPNPIVDLKTSRLKALDAYHSLKVHPADT